MTCENILSSNMKINDHSCYGDIINFTFCSESEMVWYFCGIYIMNRTLPGCVETQNFSSHVEEYFTPSLQSLVKYFSILKEKFCISTLSCLLSRAMHEKLTPKIPREGIYGIDKTKFLF